MKHNRNGNPNRRRGLLHALRRINKIRDQPTKLPDNIQLNLKPIPRLVQRKRFDADAVAAHIMTMIVIGQQKYASHANNLGIEQ